MTLPQSAKPQWMPWCTHHVAYVLNRNPFVHKKRERGREGEERETKSRQDKTGKQQRSTTRNKGTHEKKRVQ